MSRQVSPAFTLMFLVIGCSDEHAGPSAAHAGHTAQALHACPSYSGPLPAGSPGWSDSRISYTDEQPNYASDIGAFRVTCGYSHMNYDDPLVFPNQPGLAHLHTFFGNTGADAYSTPASLRSFGNSTCAGGIANRTAYWIPTLLKNGVPLPPTNAIFYYKAGYEIADASPNVQTIPAGLRMIAGNAATTTLQTDGSAFWGCEEYIGHFPQIVDCPVGDFIQLTVVFPQCWDGVHLDSTNHKSHMAYPEEGACPTAYPVLLPEISFNVRWERTADLDISTLRLSSDCETDLPAGYSAHGDWMEAWEPEVRDTFVTQCINPTADCHANLLGDGRMLEPQED